MSHMISYMFNVYSGIYLKKGRNMTPSRWLIYSLCILTDSDDIFMEIITFPYKGPSG